MLKLDTILEGRYMFQHYFIGLILMISAAAGYVINDILDIGIDKVNKPKKVIIGKHIEVKKAYIFYFSLVIFSICSSILLSKQMESLFPLVTITITNFLLWIYSLILKRTFLIGNVLVSLILCTPVFLSWLVFKVNFFNFQMEVIHTLLLLFISIFLINLSREIIKDIEDIQGDALFKSKSIPQVLGVFWSKILTVLLILILVLMLAFFIQKILSLMVIIPLLICIIMIILAKDKVSYQRCSAILKLSMFLGMVLFCLI